MSPPTVHLPSKLEQRGNVRIITFTGEEVRDVENVIASELQGRTEELLGASHLLLDFTNVKYLAGVELGTLITLNQRMKASGGRLSLCNLNAQIYEIFTTTHSQTLLGICREGTTKPGGSGYTTVIQNKADAAEQTGTDYPGDPDKYVASE